MIIYEHNDVASMNSFFEYYLGVSENVCSRILRKMTTNDANVCGTNHTK